MRKETVSEVRTEPYLIILLPSVSLARPDLVVCQDNKLSYASLLTLEDAYAMIKGKMQEYEVEADALKASLSGAFPS